VIQIEEIQAALQDAHLDAWLFFDHHRRDPLAYRILGLQPEQEVTRRWYYLIPAQGEPRGLVHRIEPFMLQDLPGCKLQYSSWAEQVEGLQGLLAGCRRVAMQYSPFCSIPYISMVDAGTVELIQSLGITVVSSADLVQYFEARWSEQQLRMHLEAGRLVDEIRRLGFEMVDNRIRKGQVVTEWQVKKFLLDRFAEAGLVTLDGPIVAAGKNSANPHYEPMENASCEICKGDVLLFDMWAKLNRPRAVYYDVTWTGICGREPSAELENVFEVVRGARDRAIGRIQEAVASGQRLRGWEVDDAARQYIQARGYGEYFTHRTGHSIGEDVHGVGANMDNLETHDERWIIPRTGFSIEPGVYLGQYGVRSEVNVFVEEQRAFVTGEIQQKLVVMGV